MTSDDRGHAGDSRLHASLSDSLSHLDGYTSSLLLSFFLLRRILWGICFSIFAANDVHRRKTSTGGDRLRGYHSFMFKTCPALAPWYARKPYAKLRWQEGSAWKPCCTCEHLQLSAKLSVRRPLRRLAYLPPSPKERISRPLETARINKSSILELLSTATAGTRHFASVAMALTPLVRSTTAVYALSRRDIVVGVMH